MPTINPSNWTRFKAWFKKNFPRWLSDGLDQGLQWLVPFLIKTGVGFLVPAPRKVRYEAKVKQQKHD